MQRRLYVKKASSATINKILPITQQLTTQMNTDNDNNHQVQQLQEKINKLRQEIQDLKAERESREPDPSFHIGNAAEIERRQKELEKKQSQLENLQRQEGNNKKTMKFSFILGSNS